MSTFWSRCAILLYTPNTYQPKYMACLTSHTHNLNLSFCHDKVFLGALGTGRNEGEASLQCARPTTTHHAGFLYSAQFTPQTHCTIGHGDPNPWLRAAKSTASKRSTDLPVPRREHNQHVRTPCGTVTCTHARTQTHGTERAPRNLFSLGGRLALWQPAVR